MFSYSVFLYDYHLMEINVLANCDVGYYSNLSLE